MHYHNFLDLLICPETGEPLRVSDDGGFLQAADGVQYPVVHGVPILLTRPDRERFSEVLESEGQRMVQEYGGVATDENSPGEVSEAAGCRVTAEAFPPPPLPSEVFPPQRLPQEIINTAYSRKGEATRILSVGGGPTRNNPCEINLNIAPFSEVDVVGNATRLPFRSNSVDGVWSNAVLEHVEGAPQAVHEMVRVCEPGGFVINLVPFMQPVHAYPQDFQRYTADGLAFLMQDLEIIAKGQAVGPSYTLYELLNMYLNGPGQTCLPRWVRGLTRRTLIPALKQAISKKLDWTGRREDEVMPSLVYCIGRKR